MATCVISYDLRCGYQHRFEGWFGSSADYDKQMAGGLIACPICDSTQISKVLTAPNVGAKGNQKTHQKAQRPAKVNSSPASPQDMSQEIIMEEADTASVSNMPEMPAELAEAVEKLADLQKKVLKDSQWVGRKFADEARAIHYGETKSRIIHGETSPEEAQALAEEGVPVAPLLFPHIPPEAKN